MSETQDGLLPMYNATGKRFALKYDPEHQQHGWIFYDNHGSWVTLRKATPYEMSRAEGILKLRDEFNLVECEVTNDHN